jgi:hypothetical protein
MRLETQIIDYHIQGPKDERTEYNVTAIPEDTLLCCLYRKFKMI